MGWLLGWDSKKQLVDHFRADGFYSEGYKALKHSLCGNQHWSLIETPEGDITISLELLQCYHGEWGYKGMTETMGPNYYNCPIGYIRACSPPENEWAKEWREKVIKHHARKSKRSYEPGQRWKFGEKVYTLLEQAGPRLGWRAQEQESHSIYRIPFCYLSRAVLIEEGATAH